MNNESLNVTILELSKFSLFPSIAQNNKKFFYMCMGNLTDIDKYNAILKLLSINVSDVRNIYKYTGKVDFPYNVGNKGITFMKRKEFLNNIFSSIVYHGNIKLGIILDVIDELTQTNIIKLYQFIEFSKDKDLIDKINSNKSYLRLICDTEDAYKLLPKVLSSDDMDAIKILIDVEELAVPSSRLRKIIVESLIQNIDYNRKTSLYFGDHKINNITTSFSKLINLVGDYYYKKKFNDQKFSPVNSDDNITNFIIHSYDYINAKNIVGGIKMKHKFVIDVPQDIQDVIIEFYCLLIKKDNNKIITYKTVSGSESKKKWNDGYNAVDMIRGFKEIESSEEDENDIDKNNNYELNYGRMNSDDEDF